MQKVVTINLNGNAYQLDEAAYDALRAYLDHAEIQLRDNPDRAEVVADLEQAIAEKCNKVLGPHKTVVTAEEMAQILKEMGPVEGGSQADADAGKNRTTDQGPAAGARPRKRLYRIREGAMWAGVCNGIAAYIGIDVVFVRIIFVILMVWTAGLGFMGYWILAMIIPEAYTSDDRAAAHGEPPFNAQEIIDQAKKTAADFKGAAEYTGREWKRQFHEQRRQWRAQHRQWRRQWRDQTRTRWWGPPGPSPLVSPAVGYSAGLMMPIFSIISVALFVVLIASMVSLIDTGAIFWWPLPAGMPVWAGMLIVFVLFQIVTAPIRAARHASYYAWDRYHGLLAVWDGLFSLAVTILVFWLLYTHMPPTHGLRELLHNLPEAFRSLGHEVSMWFRDLGEKLR